MMEWAAAFVAGVIVGLIGVLCWYQFGSSMLGYVAAAAIGGIVTFLVCAWAFTNPFGRR